jgi:poly(ADP-ribose) glycohydrolase ARH3
MLSSLKNSFSTKCAGNPAGIRAFVKQKNSMINKESFSGCFLGLALGDALCAPYEGGLLERIMWQLIGRTGRGKKRYTDDTQMSMDTAESLCENRGVDQEHLARTFASSYRWSRGYGRGAARTLKKIKQGANWQEVNRSRYPEGSYGNGAAMRAPIPALYFHGDESQINQATEKISAITHTHPLAIEGAQLVALSTSVALSQANFSSLFEILLKNSTLNEYQIRIERAGQWLEEKKAVETTTVVEKLGNGIAALDSCVTALYIAARHIDLPFSDMLKFVIQCSGDTDTIGAMAGAIWGAYNGLDGLSRADREKLESAVRIEQLSKKLYTGFTRRSQRGLSL